MQQVVNASMASSERARAARGDVSKGRKWERRGECRNSRFGRKASQAPSSKGRAVGRREDLFGGEVQAGQKIPNGRGEGNGEETMGESSS
jgi:hypothetical protein